MFNKAIQHKSHPQIGIYVTRIGKNRISRNTHKLRGICILLNKHYLLLQIRYALLHQLRFSLLLEVTVETDQNRSILNRNKYVSTGLQ
jgi:hypothetical protein